LAECGGKEEEILTLLWQERDNFLSARELKKPISIILVGFIEDEDFNAR